jgi:cyclophilin family peptidyl-prolyl cis-trans isomerase
MVMKRLQCLVALLVWTALAHAGFGGTLVQFHIFLGVSNYVGDINVELYDHDKPITVNNFVRLMKVGAYHNSFFHRCEPNFVLQGGGYFTFNPFDTNIIATPFSNLGAVGNFGNITNEYGVGPVYNNAYGTIAMAKVAGNTNSANSQFYFNLINNTPLDGPGSNNSYVVFGHVLSGTNVLNKFNTYSIGNHIVNLPGLFPTLPTGTTGTSPPPYDQLVYYIANFLTEQVTVTTNGSRQISWNSISELTNSVEYETSVGAPWNVLTNLVGTGTTVSVIDTNTTDAERLYRIHILP